MIATNSRMFMNDIFEIIVRYFFENDKDDDNLTLKKLIIMIFKIIIFLLVITIGLWIALKFKKQINLGIKAQRLYV